MTGFGFLTAGIVLALMSLPFMSAIMRDVFRMVPPVVKESAYGIGATTWEVAKDVTMRYGMQGLLGAVFPRGFQNKRRCRGRLFCLDSAFVLHGDGNAGFHFNFALAGKIVN